MNSKPVNPTMHGVIDYAFAGVQLALPSAIGLNAKLTKTYQLLGAGFLVVNALTDTPVGLANTLSFKDHQKADASFLAGLTTLTAANFIRKDTKALSFHLGFLAAAVAHFILTDYNAKA